MEGFSWLGWWRDPGAGRTTWPQGHYRRKIDPPACGPKPFGGHRPACQSEAAGRQSSQSNAERIYTNGENLGSFYSAISPVPRLTLLWSRMAGRSAVKLVNHVSRSRRGSRYPYQI